MATQDTAAMNRQFMTYALERNYAQQQKRITSTSQLIDIEMDSVPGWASSIDLNVTLNVNITATTLPTLSAFAPWNIFREVAISLGGGPFQRTSPYFHFLREMVSSFGWNPTQSSASVPYAPTTLFNIPTITSGLNVWKFTIRVPLQVQPGSTVGLVPLGSSATKMKLNLTTANSLWGTDQYYNPLTGGTGVTATIDGAQISSVTPVINYYTTPATRAEVPVPYVGSILNVQEKATAFIGAGTLTPVKFPDPFRYLRLWHIILDGTGAPTSTAVNAFEMDLTPGYPQYQYSDHPSLSSYFYKVRRAYGQDLPTGVFVFDLYNGSDNFNPNGTQTVDGTYFQTLQTQVSVDSGTNVNSPAKIITFAEALSPVNF